jgi:asparagine synthase (glutamine-hydrolysing)
MSILFGICQAEGHAVEERQLIELSQATGRYAPDGTFVRASGRIGMGYQSYHTHQRSNLESHPVMDSLGNVAVFDGRLDNHAELGQLLDIQDKDAADSLIVLTAFRRWGADCFAKFIGDWALALWANSQRSLYLARDHAGTRTLYFKEAEGTILWSTYLETFIVGRESLSLNKTYAACYLACQPIRDMTPYQAIRSVLPAHYVAFHEGNVIWKAHWHWMSSNQVVYQTDDEYEQRFLSLFRQSVERRTGPGAPILAQLSGGMDSSSIVCMSDAIRKQQGAASTDLLDTISFYNDSDPDWNERPYFSLIEASRGKSGTHVRTVSTNMSCYGDTLALRFYLFPGADCSSPERELAIERAIGQRGFRSILSGIGGDEVLGGVPTALPELADLLVSFNFGRLYQQTLKWCLSDRRPFVFRIADTIRYLLALYELPMANRVSMPPWLRVAAKREINSIQRKDVTAGNKFGLSPSSIDNGTTWWSIAETLPHLYPGCLSRREYRYPYLDRDLISFLFSVPREQLVRPGRRRSLMRRAMKHLVPSEILERRRKAFLLRTPLRFLRDNAESLKSLFARSPLSDFGLVDPAELNAALDTTLSFINPKWMPPLMRAILLDRWLRDGPLGCPSSGMKEEGRHLLLPGREHTSSAPYNSPVEL